MFQFIITWFTLAITGDYIPATGSGFEEDSAVWDSAYMAYHSIEFLQSGLWLYDGHVPPEWLIAMASQIGTI